MKEELSDRDLQDFAKEVGDDSKLSLLEKALCVATGPVLGMLPPPIQRKITGGNEEAAALMSTTSRLFNGVAWPAYAISSLVSKYFGVDIDPSPGNFVTWGGLVAGADSILREGLLGCAYVFQHPYVSHLKVWGEPVTSILYFSLTKGKKGQESHTNAA